MSLKMHNVSIRIEENEIISNINIEVPKGKFIGLIGLNGTGKSTLLKAVYGINKYSGNIYVDDNDIKDMKLDDFAKKVAVLIQENNNDFDFKVEDMVMLGRLPYKKIFDNDTAEDKTIVNNSLKYVEMENFNGRYFNSLSGGEKQRVMIARVLAQKCNILILDEPTNHLDIKNQFKFFEMIKNLNFTVFAVLHDLNLAAKFCDYIYILHNSRIYAEGVPSEVLTKDILSDVFGMNVNIRVNDNNIVNVEYISSI